MRFVIMLVLLAACAGSQHEPCTSDVECSDATPRCERTSGTCVECLRVDDNCAAGTYCAPTNVCIASCTSDAQCGGLSCCDGACVDTATDPLHCGACANACMASETELASCRAGTCEEPQPAWLRDVGTGADGSISIASTANLNTDPIASGRTIADGVAYRIVPPSAGAVVVERFAAVDAFAGIAAGDEILIIALQGSEGDDVDVGNYEIAKVEAVSASAITLAAPLARFYTGLTAGHTVAIQRVPNYQDVTIAAGGVLTTGDWDGFATRQTGIVVFRARGVVAVSGSIHADGKGYRGASLETYACCGFRNGASGEGEVGGRDRDTRLALGFGAGGGGAGQPWQGDGAGGGGGGHRTPGMNGGTYGTPNAVPGWGGAGFDAPLYRLYFGGGGGNGGQHDTWGTVGPGGDGGGIVIVIGSAVALTGTISAVGETGGRPTGGCCKGGSGGGAGGSVVVIGAPATAAISAAGGLGGDDLNNSNAREGGNGGAGHVHAFE